MPSIYARGDKLWCRLKGHVTPGKWGSYSTPFEVGQEDKARRYAAEAQRAIDDRHGGAPRDTLTFRSWIATWLERRREAGHDWKADRGRLENHVMHVLGDRPLVTLRPAMIADLVRRLRFQSDPPLAARTVRNIYSVVAAALRDAAIDGMIDATPCVLTDEQLGPIVDKDREWRSGALFTRDEAEVLIAHPGIPIDRRVVYACGLLAGLRPGEAGALRLRHYAGDRLLVAYSYNVKQATTKGTKTETVKTIPVHPTFAALLDEWLSVGWAAMVGRDPTPEDLVIPLPPDVKLKRSGDRFRGYDYSGRRWREIDLPMLGWRPRSVYDTKATFITLAIEDGADPAVIRDRITHTKQKRSAFDHYDRGPHWEQTVDELDKLRIVKLDPTTALLRAAELRVTSTVSGSEGGVRSVDRPMSPDAKSPVFVGAATVRRRYTTRGVASLLRELVDVAERRDTEGAYVIACEIRRRERLVG